MESLGPKERVPKEKALQEKALQEEAMKPGGGEDLLTFGEAAEFAGVSLMELRGSLRGAQVKPHWGWRGGVALQLVSVSELESLYPILQKRHRERGLSLAERGILLVDPSGNKPSTRGHARPGMNTHSAVRSAPREQPKPITRSRKVEAPTILPEEDPLRTYSHGIEGASARSAELLSELDQTGQGIDHLLKKGEGAAASPSDAKPKEARPGRARKKGRDRRLSLEISDPEVSEQDARKAEWERLVHQESSLERKHRRVQWFSWTVAAGLMVWVAFQGQQMFFGKSANQFTTPEPDPERSERWARGNGNQSHRPNSRPVPSDGSSLAGGPLQSPFTTTGNRGGLVSPEHALAAPGLHSEDGPDDRPLDSNGDGRPGDLVPASVAAGTPEAGTEEATLVEAPLPIDGEAIGTTEAAATPTDPGTTLLGGAGEGLLALQESTDPPCRFHGLTGPGQELRSVLGPCIGPWNPKEKAVAGGFRHSGHALCRHHYSFQRDEQGSVDRASKIAQYAKTEGLVPPILRLRLDHGATQLLEAKVGKWLESGFEAVVSGSHSLKQVKGTDRWKVRSWVRLRKGPETTELRHFTMEFDLAADKGRDRLVSFEWQSPE